MDSLLFPMLNVHCYLFMFTIAHSNYFLLLFFRKRFVSKTKLFLSSVCFFLSLLCYYCSFDKSNLVNIESIKCTRFLLSSYSPLTACLNFASWVSKNDLLSYLFLISFHFHFPYMWAWIHAAYVHRSVTLVMPNYYFH